MFIKRSFYESDLNNYIILIKKNFSRESKAMKFERKKKWCTQAIFEILNLIDKKSKQFIISFEW